MSRALLALLLAAATCLTSALFPPVAAAAAPSEGEFRAVAEGYGMACAEREFFEGEIRDIQCRRDAGPNGEMPTLTATYAPPGSPITDISVSMSGPDPVPTDWVDLAIDLATLSCDAPREEVVAVMPAPDGAGDSQRQRVGSCEVAYLPTDWGDGYVDYMVTIYLDLEPEPTVAPRGSAIPMPSPIAPPDDWSTVGRSTYSGVWTVTAVSIDGELLPDAEMLGQSAPGEVVVDCRGDDTRCDVGPTPGGTFDAEMLGEGALTGTTESETKITVEDCPFDSAVRTTDLDVAYDVAGATITVGGRTTPGRCQVRSETWAAVDRTWVFDGVLIAYAGPDGDIVTDGGTPPDGEDPGAAPAPGVGEPPVRPFADSVPTVTEISLDPIVLLQSALLALLLVFLMPFPSQLFNSTLEAHEDEVRRWLRLDRLGRVGAGVGAFWASWPGVAMFAALAALLYGFLDPGFGIGPGSLATFVGMLLGIVLVTGAFAVPAVLAHRRNGSGWTLKVVPLSLLIGVACVLLSRLTGFQPGYLYGLLIGLAFARELSAAEEGRTTALGAIAMLAVAFASWLVLGALPDGEGFGLVVARTTLAALMVAGLEGVVFGLLPMRFLPGEALYAWNRVAWGSLLAIGAFAFFHILINPASGYLSDTSRTPLFTVLGLLIGFSAVSVAFWASFRYRGGSLEAEA